MNRARDNQAASEQDRDPSVDLAAWLSDSGRRTWRPSPSPDHPDTKGAGGAEAESSEELLACLEQVAGRKLRSRQEIRRFVEEISIRHREADRVHERRRLTKDTVLLLALLTAFIQYHFLDVNLQIARLPSTLVFVPVETISTPPRHRS